MRPNGFWWACCPQRIEYSVQVGLVRWRFQPASPSSTCFAAFKVRKLSMSIHFCVQPGVSLWISLCTRGSVTQQLSFKHLITALVDTTAHLHLSNPVPDRTADVQGISESWCSTWAHKVPYSISPVCSCLYRKTETSKGLHSRYNILKYHLEKQQTCRRL